MSTPNTTTPSMTTITVVTDNSNQHRIWAVGTAPQAFIADLINRPKVRVSVQYPDGTLDTCSTPTSIGILRAFFPVINNAVGDAGEDNYSTSHIIVPLSCSASAHNFSKLLKYANRIVVDNKGKLEPYGPIYQNPYSEYLGLAEVAQALGVSAILAELTGRFKAILYKGAGGKSEYFRPQIAGLKTIYSMGLPKNHWARIGLETSIALSALDGNLQGEGRSIPQREQGHCQEDQGDSGSSQELRRILREESDIGW
ncbi:hypothetical protein PMZ80_000720 [Knufia obscura]|uniref:Uncharacterized protein n=1 Tax=Knufia obscura TaxID=1635080 RepID=A0ABR0S132_9EURO|nr:hypothetical protein PMZ80_000720 [Knufia obscura]